MYHASIVLLIRASIPEEIERHKQRSKNISIINAWIKNIGLWCNFEMSKKIVFQTNFDSYGIQMNLTMRLPLFPSIVFQVTLPCVIVIFT